MAYKLTTNIEKIGSLKQEWTELIKNSDRNNLFLAWEWVNSWCMNMINQSETPVIITARIKDRLIGVAPLVIVSDANNKTIVRFLGQAYSYHLGFVAEKGFEERVYHALLDHLFNKFVKGIYQIEFIHFDENLIFDSVLANQVKKRRLVFEKGLQNPCKILSLPDTFDAYFKSGIVSHNLKQNIKKDFRKLEKECQIKFFQADNENFRKYWFEMIDLHREMIEYKNKNSILLGHQFPNHLQQVAECFLKNNSLRLNILSVNHQTAAILLGIIYNDTFNALTMGINIKLIQELPWLNLVITSHILSIKSAITDKCKKYDLLGGYHDYKYKLGAIDKGGVKIMIRCQVNQSGKNKSLLSYFSKPMESIKSYFQDKFTSSES